MFVFVMDKIEILNVLRSGPPKVALVLHGFFLISAHFGQMRNMGLDGCSFSQFSFLSFPIIPIRGVCRSD